MLLLNTHIFFLNMSFIINIFFLNNWLHNQLYVIIIYNTLTHNSVGIGTIRYFILLIKIYVEATHQEIR